MIVTTVKNNFTGYSATLRTKEIPAAATLRKHVRNAKGKGCMSATCIFTNVQEDGIGDEVIYSGGEFRLGGQFIS